MPGSEKGKNLPTHGVRSGSDPSICSVNTEWCQIGHATDENSAGERKVKPGGTDLCASLNGTFSQLAHAVTGWATGDVLRLEVRTVASSTARLTVYRNETELFSYDDSEHFIASGQPGIGLNANTGSMSLDDWEGGDTAILPGPSDSTP